MMKLYICIKKYYSVPVQYSFLSDMFLRQDSNLVIYLEDLACFSIPVMNCCSGNIGSNFVVVLSFHRY